MQRVILLSVAMTLVLGCSIALAFYLVGGSLALRGPFVIRTAWPAIYPLVILFAFVIGTALGRQFATRLSLATLGLVILIAWVGEYLVVASRLLADELTPLVSIGVWLLATAGPIQPLAAFIGAAIGRQKVRPA